MTMELITGSDGTEHVSAADDGALYASIVGAGNYGSGVLSGLELSMPDANTATIGTGVLWHNGRGVRVSTPESVALTSGTQGQSRWDVIAARYEADAQGRESEKLVVLQGQAVPTGQTPKYPAVDSPSVLGGASRSDMALYGVKLSGATVASTERLFQVVPTLIGTQDAGNVRTGVLPVSRGGTGGGSADAARASLRVPKVADALRSAYIGANFGISPAQRVIVQAESSSGTDATSFACDGESAGLYDQKAGKWLWRIQLKNTTGVLAAADGGTGVTTAQAERNRLGLGNTTGPVPVASGGTGSTSKGGAQSALGFVRMGNGTSDAAVQSDTGKKQWVQVFAKNADGAQNMLIAGSDSLTLYDVYGDNARWSISPSALNGLMSMRTAEPKTGFKIWKYGRLVQVNIAGLDWKVGEYGVQLNVPQDCRPVGDMMFAINSGHNCLIASSGAVTFQKGAGNDTNGATIDLWGSFMYLAVAS